MAGRTAREELYALNAVRKPELWKRLDKAKLKKTLRGPRSAVLKGISDAAGIPIDLPDDQKWQAVESEALARGGVESLLYALEQILRDSSTEAIFESGRIRLLKRKEALEFWTAWWEKEKERKRPEK